MAKKVVNSVGGRNRMSNSGAPLVTEMKHMYMKNAAISPKMNCLKVSGPRMWSSASISWRTLYVDMGYIYPFGLRQSGGGLGDVGLGVTGPPPSTLDTKRSIS